ncbi:MAG: histidinol phosphate phosphatase domain-containing protein [Chloroflexi bacterium]|nr:histidinol phosphate phosphatase domain-containing protein [Chloroflexota bacterium]
MRIDLHTHTFFSDGEMLPSELLRRAVVNGTVALAITDHADASNLEEIINRLQNYAVQQAADFELEFLVGIELTHVLPARIGMLAEDAKRLGADIVVVHGETLAEPVAKGTNRAAVESPFVDVLAHPGFITIEEARIAAATDVHLELTSRLRHALTNGHTAQVAREAGARLAVNSDAHSPADLLDEARAIDVALGAGLSVMEAESAVIRHPRALVEKIVRRRNARLA